MFSAVLEVAPDLFSFVHSAYSEPSFLFCGEHILSSAGGVQQGDPLSPLLFCLTIQPVVEKLHLEFKVFFLDDGTLEDSLQDVLHDLHLVEEEAASLSL